MRFDATEIVKLLNTLIGETEAVDDDRVDECRLLNLKTLIEVVSWGLDEMSYAMYSGYGKTERSMIAIRETARQALKEYGEWIAEILGGEGEHD